MHCDNTSWPTRLSVIVPMVGYPAHIEGCIESLRSQTAPATSFEVIVVDDGSHDDSLASYRQNADAYPSISILACVGGDACAARNTGIESALGEYIMFMEPADTISPITISSLVATFDALGDDVDVVSCRTLPDHADIEKKKHAHEGWLAKTGLYPLEDNPHIAKTATNVCVRNRGAENIAFDPASGANAMQLYIAQNLERRGSIGYCREAEYIRGHDAPAAVPGFENPFTSHDEMLSFFERLLAIAGGDPAMRGYAHSLLLSSVNERMTSSKLLANHLSGPEREKADERLARIMSAIPFDDYIGNPDLDEFRTGYLLKTFKFPSAAPSVRYEGRHAIVAFDDECTWTTARPSVAIERCLYHNSTLIMRGRMVGPSLLFEEQPVLTIACGEDARTTELAPSSHCYTSKKMPMKVARAWSFSCRFDLQGISKGTPITFTASIGGRNIAPMGVSLNPGVHNYRLINKTRCFPGLEIDVRENDLALYPRSSLEQRKTSLNAARHNKALAGERRKIAAYARKNARNRMWMYVDLPSSRTEGNALVAMLHDLRQNDGIERYYVSDFGEDLSRAHPPLEGRVVRPGGEEHRCLSLRAEMVVCSYLERETFSPFTFKEYPKYADFAVDQRRVYVQHGILHARIPWYFSFDRLHIDAEAISTTMEEASLRKTYGFPEEALIRSGAPRLDHIEYGSVRASRKILYVPSWRSYLVGGNAKRREAEDDVLISSSFYQGLMAFVELVSQSTVLEEHGYSLEIKLHPNFKCYEHLFRFESPRVALAPDNIDEQDYPIVITDFSSYVYDFIYAGSDIVYFLPDHVEFAAGLNHYSELEVPLDQAFGPYCESPDELLDQIEKLVEGNADADAYRRKGHDLFLHTDGKNCDRLYKALKSMADALHARG